MIGGRHLGDTRLPSFEPDANFGAPRTRLKRDDGHSYPAYDECTSRYLCRTCADKVFARCKDVFDRFVMGGGDDDAEL